jgi:hypothetical protein
LTMVLDPVIQESLVAKSCPKGPIRTLLLFSLPGIGSGGDWKGMGWGLVYKQQRRRHSKVYSRSFVEEYEMFSKHM